MKQVLNKYDIDKSFETENAREKYIGRIFQSNSWGKYKVLGTHSREKQKELKYVVEFLETGNQSIVTGTKINTGAVRDLFAKTVKDMGYIGNYSGVVSKDQFYQTWSALLDRVFSPAFIKNHPTYEGCTISDDWLCFDTFQKNCKELMGYKEKEIHTDINFEIDKDVLFHKNKHYSKENCIWLPRKLNSFYSNFYSTNKTGFEGVFTTKCNRYRARVSINGVSKYIGCYKTPIEAYLKCCELKSEVLEMYLVDDYPFLDERIKEALRSKLLCQREERINNFLINQSDPMHDVDRIVSKGKGFEIV